jgi:hypothetical protein
MFKSENFLLTFYAPSPPPSPRRLPAGRQGERGSVMGKVKCSFIYAKLNNVYQLLFRGFGRGSGSGIIRSGVRTHSGMDSTRAFSLAPAPSTRSMRGEDSSKTFMLCRERTRFTSSAGLDPSPRYRKMNRLIQISL